MIFASATSTSSTSTMPSLAEMRNILDRFKPLPRREFVYDGVVFGVFEHGEIRVSPVLYAAIKKHAKSHSSLHSTDFNATPLIPDCEFPRAANNHASGIVSCL